MYYLPETISALGYPDLEGLAGSMDNWGLKLINYRRLIPREDLYSIAVEDYKMVPKNATEGASFLRNVLEDRLHFNAESKTWYAWNGTIHAPLTSDTVPLQIIDFLGVRYDQLTEIYDSRMATMLNLATTKEDAAKVQARYEAAGNPFRAFGRSIQTNKGVKDILDKLKRCPGIAVTQKYFEDDRNFLVVRNGVIDLEDYRSTRAVTLLKHDAARPVTRYFDAEFDLEAEASQWDAFLASSIVDDGGDTVKLLQKAVGAAFSAEEKPRALFNLLGAPASGKSVFLSVFNRLGQDYSVMPNNQAIQLNNGDTNFYQDALRNKRFVGFSEVQGKKPLDDGFIKGVIGGDEQNTRQMRQMEVPWKPQCVLFIASNLPLKFNTRDEATFIKILPVPFPHSFTDEDPEHQMDRELENKVLAERNGILRWVLEGMAAFWETGLNPTAAVLQAMNGNKTANSHALQFMEALIEAGHVEKDNMAPVSGCLPIGTAYEMFGHWALQEGVRNIPGKMTFTSDVADFYFGKKKSGTWTFLGLKKSPELQVNLANGVSLAHMARSL